MAFTQEDLDDADYHVAEGERHIAKQAALIDRHVRLGLRVENATDLLDILRDAQVCHVRHRNLIRDYLGR